MRGQILATQSIGWIPRRLQQWGFAAWLLVIGLLIAILPLPWVIISLVTLTLVLLTLINPLYGIGVALILGPTKPTTEFFFPQLPLDLGQWALIVTLIVYVLHRARSHRILLPTSPLNLPLILFLIAAALSLLNALSIGFALKELIKWIQLVLMMWMVIDLGQGKKLKVVVGLLIAAALIQALIGFWQFGLRGDGPEHFQILGGRFYRAYGSFEQPNPYGGFIGLVLPLSVGLTLHALEVWIYPIIRRWQESKHVDLQTALNVKTLALTGWVLVTLILGAALVMSWSRGAWLGFGAAGVAILLAWPRKTWLGLALVVMGISGGWLALDMGILPASIVDRLTGFTSVFASFDVRGVDINDVNYSVLERLAHWQAAQEMARYQPWFGIGFGNYEPVYPAYALINWPYPLGHAHNFYLNTLAETGIIGLSAYLILWGSVFWTTWRITRTSEGWIRGTALGLLGSWSHLSIHSFLDKLYVANLHLHIGAMLGLLTLLAFYSVGRSNTSD
jgi:O-antigen ligase